MKHYHAIIQPGDVFQPPLSVCGFWPDADTARAAIQSAYPGGVVTYCERSTYCTD